jgi:hypothetical protein
MARATEDFNSVSDFMRELLDQFGIFAEEDKSETFPEERAVKVYSSIHETEILVGNLEMVPSSSPVFADVVDIVQSAITRYPECVQDDQTGESIPQHQAPRLTRSELSRILLEITEWEFWTGGYNLLAQSVTEQARENVMDGVVAMLGKVAKRIKDELALMDTITSVAKAHGKTLEHSNRDDRVRDMVGALTIDERDAVMSGDTAALSAKINTW